MHPIHEHVQSEDVINPVAIGDAPAHGSPKAGFEPATSQSRILRAASSATTGLNIWSIRWIVSPKIVFRLVDSGHFWSSYGPDFW